MSWGLTLWLLSYLPRSILHLSLSLNLGGHNVSLDQSFPVFLWCVFQLNCRGGGGIELICIQGKSAQECSHTWYFSTALWQCVWLSVHQGRAAQSARKIHLHTKHRSTVPVILSENKVKKQSDAHKCSVYVSVSQVICFSTDYSLNHCSHKQRIAKILHPPNYPPHILYKNYTAHLCPGVDKRNRAG